MGAKFKNWFISYFDKWGHPSYTVLGVILIGVGCAFVGSYKLAAEWSKVSDVVTLIVFIVTNTLMWISIGAGLYLLSEYIRYEKTKLIGVENQTLKGRVASNENLLNNVNNEVRDLKKAVNEYQENIQFLSNQIYELQNKIAVSWLKQAFKQHEMNSTERATIYFELNKEFSLLARYSPNPELNEIHRQKFPLNQGVISHAWRNGSYIEDECPNFEDDEEIYYDYMSSKYQFDKRQLQNFQMKSCRYVAVAIRNVDDHIGVVVFESIDKEKLSQAKLQELNEYCETYQPYLAEFIQKSKALEVAKRMDSAGTMENADSDMLSSLSAKAGNS